MKAWIFVVVLSAVFVLTGRGEDTPSPFRQAIQSVRERYTALEMERRDYRKPKPDLSPAKEEERLRLLSRLVQDDPVWVLTQEIQADLDVLVAVQPPTPATTAIVESLKDILAIVMGYEERASSAVEAQKFADTMRRFTVLRDADGARVWAKAR